jgi:type II secretion system protein C
MRPSQNRLGIVIGIAIVAVCAAAYYFHARSHSEGEVFTSSSDSEIVNVPEHRQNNANDGAPTNNSKGPASLPALVLTGTIAANDPARGYAFIRTASETAKLFSVDGEVAPRTTLRAVYGDRVVLSTDGFAWTLHLSDGASADKLGPKAIASQATRLSDVSSDQFEVMNRLFHLQSEYEDGIHRGFRLSPGANDQAFAKLGLLPGDIAIAINGQPLEDSQRGVTDIARLIDSPQIRMTIVRHGSARNITLRNLAALAAQDEASLTGTVDGGVIVTPFAQSPL